MKSEKQYVISLTVGKAKEREWWNERKKKESRCLKSSGFYMA